ncbi:MAG: hypothetical protein M0C28_07980 [Candidatus Moduliflexus flocculans]|nr:hypothetical protein [Candidatus Moduliflexus flocculans]
MDRPPHPAAWMEARQPARHSRELAARGAFRPLQIERPRHLEPGRLVQLHRRDRTRAATASSISSTAIPKTYLPDPLRLRHRGGGQKTLPAGQCRILPDQGRGRSATSVRGQAFWQILEDHDVPATIFKIPSNYPPVPSKQRTLAG